MVTPERRPQKPELKSRKDNLYGKTHLWYRNAWAELMKLERMMAHTSTPPDMAGVHEADLAGIKKFMQERNGIRQSQIKRLYEISRKMHGK